MQTKDYNVNREESELSYIKMLKIILYANIPHVCDVEV